MYTNGMVLNGITQETSRALKGQKDRRVSRVLQSKDKRVSRVLQSKARKVRLVLQSRVRKVK